MPPQRLSYVSAASAMTRTSSALPEVHDPLTRLGGPCASGRTCEQMTFQQGARVALGSRLVEVARRGAIGGTSGSRPPRSPFGPTLPKVTIGGWRWGIWWEMSQGTRGTMTGAHLGDRGAGRRRSCSATAAPQEGARRRGHGDGRHHPRPQRSFFSPNSDRRVILLPVTKIMLMNQPHRF